MWMRKILTEPLYVIMWNSSGRRSSIGYVYVGTKIFAQPADEGHYVLIIFTTTTNVAIEEPHLESFSCLPPSIIIHEMSSCFGIIQLLEGRKSMRIYCSVCLFALLLIIFIRNNGNRIRSRLLVSTRVRQLGSDKCADCCKVEPETEDAGGEWICRVRVHVRIAN